MAIAGQFACAVKVDPRGPRRKAADLEQKATPLMKLLFWNQTTIINFLTIKGYRRRREVLGSHPADA